MTDALRAEYLSFDAFEDPIDFPDPRMRLLSRDGSIVLSVWSGDGEDAGLGVDQFELTLTPGQAWWLAGRLYAVAIPTAEGHLGLVLRH